jgi:hypothetical protein
MTNLWTLYNLRESPFFQEQLRSDPDARYPVELFVGRQREVARLVGVVREKAGSSSRQTVQGPPGRGKSTLVQQVKAILAKDGFLSHPEAISVGSADSTQTLLLRIVKYVYGAILAAAPNAAIRDTPPMATARQLTLAFQGRAGGGGLSLPAVGGINLAVSTQYQTPQAALEVLIPELLHELSALAREQLGARGILLHMNNLEALSNADAETAARIVQDLRDPLLMAEGFHTIVVGADEAIRSVVLSVRQVRDVFSSARPLPPLTLPEILQLLERRYEHLRAEKGRPPRKPVDDDAVAELHTLFRGNLRGLLNALEDGAHTLIDYGFAGGAPMTRDQLRGVLRGRYQETLEAELTRGDVRLLQQVAEAGLFEGFTQSQLARVWDVSRATVSGHLKRWEGNEYITETEPVETGRKRGRPERAYILSPVVRLAFEPLPDTTALDA